MRYSFIVDKICKISAWVLVIFILTTVSASCDTFKRKQAQEDVRINKTQKDITRRQQEREEAYKKEVKRRQKGYDKETRQRMKELEKKSKRWNDNKKEPFYERWYYKWSETRENKRSRRKD